MNTSSPSVVRAPTGPHLSCKTWAIEAAYRTLQNNLDPAVAERPQDLVVYGGIGKAARNWQCFHAILNSLRQLNPDETLLIQSGKPVGIVPTHPDAPRVLIANSNLVPQWANWEHFNALDRMGLMMYGQMTAGSWIYIGTQGILQGTYETFAACGRKYFEGTVRPLLGKVVVSGGLGGMGGAQPLAAKLAGGVFIGVEINPEKVERRLQTGYLDEKANSFDEAIANAQVYARNKIPCSIGVVGNAGDFLCHLLKIGFIPDVVTDQTSAHDPLNGYYPTGLSFDETNELRRIDSGALLTQIGASIARHVEAMLELKRQGAVVFDYGNNIRSEAQKGGVSNAFDIKGFVPEFIRPLFCEGAGPFRWVALSGDPKDIYATDKALLELLPDNATMVNWLTNGAPQIAFQGLPARICWLRHGEREKAGVLFNELVRTGKVCAPIVIGRDHLDCGSVAAPTRETEAMLDGSDAVSDWVFLNAMVNAVNGATWVSVHHGGGVGMGYSQHAGMVVVADGTPDAERRLRRVLNSDPSIGIMRHADAGYPSAIEWAQMNNVKIPMLEV